MRSLLAVLFALSVSLSAWSQTPVADDATARVGELLNSSDYITLGEELPSLRANVAKPLLALADALVAHCEG